MVYLIINECYIAECWPEDVPSPPVFITPLGSQTFHEGSEMNLRCLASGVPLPTVQVLN